MAVNIPRLAVTSLTERLRVIGFTKDGSPASEVWADWIGNDMDQLAVVAHREALTLGSSYVIVWADEAGNPTVSVESARQVAVVRDPGTRRITAAVKRWETDKTTEAVLYGPDEIIHYRADHTGGVTGCQFHVVETIPNPLGMVPVVALSVTRDRLLDDGVSEMEDLLPLVDALNKVLADMMVSSEYYARPRRWATGLELEEDEEGNAINPIPNSNRAMISESPDTKFGQLPAADLSSYESSVRVLTSQIMAVSWFAFPLSAHVDLEPAERGFYARRRGQLCPRGRVPGVPSSAGHGRTWPASWWRSVPDRTPRMWMCVSSGRILQPALSLKRPTPR